MPAKVLVCVILFAGFLDSWRSFAGTVTTTPLAVLSGHTGPIQSVAFSPNGALVVTGSDDETARIWNASNGNLSRTLVGHTGGVLTAAFSSNGQQVVTAGRDGRVIIWNLPQGILATSFSVPGVTCALFTPDRTKIAVGCSDGKAKLIRTVDGIITTTFTHGSTYTHGKPVRCMAFSRDGSKLAVGSYAGRFEATPEYPIVVWNTSDGSIFLKTTFDPNQSRGQHDYSDVRSIAIFSDGERVFGCGSVRVHVYIFPDIHFYPYLANYDVTSRWEKNPRVCNQFRPGHSAAALSPSNEWLVVINNDTVAELRLPVNNPETITSFVGHSKTINSVCFSPDQTKILTGSGDTTARIWASGLIPYRPAAADRWQLYRN